MTITDDEYTVLMIADQGQYLAPIGRWEQSVRNLHARGLLKKLDDVNFIMNDAGRAALAAREKQDDQALANIYNAGVALKNAHEQARQSIEQASIHLSHAVKASVKATGHPQEHVLNERLKAIKERAMEMLKDG